MNPFSSRMTPKSKYLICLVVIVTFTIIYISWNILSTRFIYETFIYSSYDDTQKYEIDDKLFKQYQNFSLPSTNKKILQTISFQIFPSNSTSDTDDRIYNQMRYVPSYYSNHKEIINEKLILLYNGPLHIYFGDFQLCPVSKCRITSDKKMVSVADVILWIGSISPPNHVRPKKQSWALLFHESPMHTPNVEYFEKYAKSMINWTISYRPDSTLPHPYYKYSPYDLINIPPKSYPFPHKNYANGKSKMAASFVSNCFAANNRQSFVKELQKFIEVDVYGRCGTLSCQRNVAESCFEMLNKKYKFYLSFENSYCRNYITEKFFKNGLSNDVIPVVLGAHPNDYKRVSPPHSYIHVDDFNTISDLANYLKYLDKNDTAFNEYFAWKPYGTVNFNQFFYCRLCMMAHEGDQTETFYTNIHNWWHDDKINKCFKSGKWKDHM